MLFIVKIVLVEDGGWFAPLNLVALIGTIGPPNYNSLNIIVNWGSSLLSDSYDIKINIIFNKV